MYFLKRLLQIVGGSFMAFWCLFGMVPGATLLGNEKSPVLGTIVGLVILLIGGTAFVACLRLVFNRPASGGLFSPRVLKIISWVVLLFPIAGLFTGWWWQHPLRSVAMTIAYYGLYLGLQRTARERQSPPVHQIDPEDPVIVAAIERVQASLPELKQCWTKRTGPMFVKFPFVTDGGTTEHVWGELLAIEGEEFRADIGTPPVTHDGDLPEFVSMPLSSLRDWIEPLEDGRARGGYFSRAEIAYCRFHKQPVPEQMLAMEFVDA